MATIMFIQDIFNITGVGIVTVGEIKQGVLRLGMNLDIDGKVMTVKSIEMKHRKISEAYAGCNVGIFLENGDFNLLKSVVKTEVVFSGKGQIPKPEANHPKGIFGSIKNIFRK